MSAIAPRSAAGIAGKYELVRYDAARSVLAAVLQAAGRVESRREATMVDRRLPCVVQTGNGRNDRNRRFDLVESGISE